MKQYKFRTWNFEDERMILMSGYFSHSPYQDKEKYKWMQFIGLQDINEKDIYEGDIVRYGYVPLSSSGIDYDIGEVVWVEEDLSFQILPIDRDKDYCYETDGGWNKLWWFATQEGIIEIIGNIYENKYH